MDVNDNSMRRGTIIPNMELNAIMEKQNNEKEMQFLLIIFIYERLLFKVLLES